MDINPVLQRSSVDSTTALRDSLPLPDTVQRDKVIWAYAIIIAAMHLLALLVFVPWLFTWVGLIALVAGVPIFGQGINLCYHRLLAHGSFRVPKWLERFFVIVALCCLQETPGKWVAVHRYHHNHSDEQDDPHSPLVTFFWAHLGWLMIKNPGTHNIATYQKYARDVMEDPFYLRLEKGLLWFWIYLGHTVVYFAIGLAIGWAITHEWVGALRFGLSLFLWGAIARTVIVWHVTWSVNSLTHLFGYRSYKTGENSRNNWFVAMIAVGEGWHNNHHYDPASATVQHRWWEIDPTYYVIKLLEWLGLATNVVPLKQARRAARAAERYSRRTGAV